MRVERAGAAEGDEAPDLAEQLLFREDAGRLARELGQKLELLRREGDRETVDGHAARRAVERDRPGGESASSLRPRPPEHCVDPCDELLVVEGSGDEVVAATLEGVHAVDRVGAGLAEDDHRDVAVPGAAGLSFAQAPADIGPVSVL